MSTSSLSVILVFDLAHPARASSPVSALSRSAYTASEAQKPKEKAHRPRARPSCTARGLGEKAKKNQLASRAARGDSSGVEHKIKRNVNKEEPRRLPRADPGGAGRNRELVGARAAIKTFAPRDKRRLLLLLMLAMAGLAARRGDQELREKERGNISRSRAREKASQPARKRAQRETNKRGERSSRPPPLK